MAGPEEDDAKDDTTSLLRRDPSLRHPFPLKITVLERSPSWETFCVVPALFGDADVLRAALRGISLWGGPRVSTYTPLCRQEERSSHQVLFRNRQLCGSEEELVAEGRRRCNAPGDRRADKRNYNTSDPRGVTR